MHVLLRMFLFSWQALMSANVHTESGRATTFYPKERLNDGKLACDGWRQWTDPEERVCAHRTLPCKTVVVMENVQTGATSWCRVLDRGPYGARSADGSWFIKRNATVTGSYLGVIDIGPRLRREIHSGSRTLIVKLWWVTFDKKLRTPHPLQLVN